MKRGVGACAAFVAVGLGLLAVADAQPIDPKRPRTLTVGPPRGVSPTSRVDGRRSGFAQVPLPAGALRIAWRRTLNLTVEHAPLVFENGDVAVVTGRCDVAILDSEGTEKLHGPAIPGASNPGASTLLSDGTVVFVTAQGDAIGVRGDALRFRTRFVGPGSPPASGTTNERAAGGVAPLGLSDGGVVVGSGTELATLDADGAIRARATLDEPIAAPLVSAMGKVAVTTVSGKVMMWSPGREPMRVGSFGGPIDARSDDGAALVDDHTLLAVLEGKGQLVELDLVTGIAVTRATASSGLFLGPPSIRGGAAHLLGVVPGRIFALTIDATGQEVARIGLVTFLPSVFSDGGPVPLTAPAHVGTIVDGTGTLAFTTADGKVGVVTAAGAVEMLGEPLCGRGLLSSPTSAARGAAIFAGIAPSGVSSRSRSPQDGRNAKSEASFVVACENGTLAKISSLSLGE